MNSVPTIVKLNRLFLASLMVATLALMVSYWAEIVWQLELCRLCEWQRGLWILVAILSFFGLCGRKKYAARLMLGTTFVSLFSIAMYHIAIQTGLLVDPCTIPQSIKTLEEYRALLSSPPPCSKAALAFLGIPLPWLNAAISLAFAFTIFISKSADK